MWSDVEKQLVNLLTRQLYPKLLSDPGYRILLYEAGLISLPGVKVGQSVAGPFLDAQNAWYQSKPMLDKPSVSGQGKLSPAQLRRLFSVARLRARLMLMEVKDLECLVEEGAQAKLLATQGSIYRVWDAQSRNQTRHWWFSEELKHRAIRESRQQGIKPGEWIRNALAISLDFGKCDMLSRISLQDLEGIPVIEALGLPKPQRTTVHRDRSGETRGMADADYWLRLGKFYTGHQTQYFVPYLPPELMKPDVWT